MSSVPSTLENKPPVLSKRMELLVKVVMILAGPIFIIFLLEAVGYIWERGQANSIYAWELVASRRIELDEYPEPGAGYTLFKPNGEYEWQEIPVTINSHGLRGPETTFEKPDNTFRVLNLGDSIAMGWGVREEETYGRYLEQMLNEQVTDGRNVEVINAGIPGWNPANELAYLRAEGLRYEPDLVLLDLTIVNDIYGKSALQKDNSPAFIEWLRAETHFWPFLSVQFRTIQARADGRERIDVIDPPTEPSSYFPMDSKAERWDSIWNTISAIKDEAGGQGAEFLLVMFPLEYQVLDEAYSTLPQEVLTEKAAESGIPVLDLLSAYRQACLEKAGGACELEDRYLFADVWMHPSAFGNELTAAEILKHLDGLLDS